jgi:DNA sulfur modification protein DndD
MLLRELTLHNFGVYLGRQTVELTTTPERPVVLVGGLNGCGKTTFLDALQLVLYGNRARCSNRGSLGYEDFLRQSVSRGVRPEDGSSLRLVFTVTLDGAERTYQVTRAWAAVGRRMRESVEVLLDGRHEAVLSESWAEHVEELLPLEIASLFFFDGEKIEALADPDRASTVIQTAVYSLLGIATLEQLRTDLVALQRRQTPASGDEALEQKILDLQAERSRVQQELDAAVQRLGHVTIEHNLAGTELERRSLAFARDGGEIFERRLAIEAEREQVRAQLEQARGQLRALAEGPLPLALVAEQVEAARVQAAIEMAAAQATRVAEILEERDAQFVSLLAEPTIRAKLERELRADRAKRLSDAEAPQFLRVSDEGFGRLHAHGDVVAAASQTACALIETVHALDDRLSQLDAQLAGVPAEDVIARRMAERDDARVQLALLAGQRLVLAEDDVRLRRVRSELDERLARAEGERLRTAVMRDDAERVIAHSARVRDTLALLRERLVAKHLSKLEVATLDSFQSLLRKRGLIKDLRIRPDDFALELIGRDGEVLAPSRLSAGERQLLAIALLWGLARVAGHRLPTVIDTPLGRLDSGHRQHLVERYFPQASRQVLLLSTDEEINEDLLFRLKSSVSHAYLLDHDDKEHKTVVRSGYWWPLEVPDVA